MNDMTRTIPLIKVVLVLDKFGNTEGTVFYSPVQSCIYHVMPLCSVKSVLLFGLLVTNFIFISMLFCVTLCGTRMSHTF